MSESESESESESRSGSNSGSKSNIEHTLDTSGSLCPMPIIEAAKAMANLSEGAVLVLWATDPAIESDLPAWCEACGHTLLSLERREARFIGRVSKGSR